MSKLLKAVLSAAKKAELSDGIHENCILVAVSNEDRKTKDGKSLNRHCFTKFGQVKDGQVVAESEISWYNPLAFEDGRYDAIFSMIDQFNNIIEEIYEEKNHPFHTAVNDIFADLEIENLEEFKNLVEEDGKSTGKILKRIYEAYVVTLQSKIEDKVPVRFKLVFDNKGKNLQQPKYGMVIENMNVEKSELTITEREKENKLKSTQVIAKPALSSATLANI